MTRSNETGTSDAPLLATIFDGWEGYHTSIVHALRPLSPAQLAWRPRPNLRSVGELAAHIAGGRIVWFARMPAPGSLELLDKLGASSEAAAAENLAELLGWLEASWQMIAATLSRWTVADLRRTYRQEYQGQAFAVSYQWTIWRIMTHDIHHGGELALMLGLQGIAVPELGDQFGHLTMPPLAE